MCMLYACELCLEEYVCGYVCVSICVCVFVCVRLCDCVLCVCVSPQCRPSSSCNDCGGIER